MAFTNKKVAFKLGLLFCIWVFQTACNSSPDLPQDIAQAYLQLPEQIDYNFHVKPILSDKCFACHGPDKDNQKAGLRLDTKLGAFAKLESGEGQAVVPGKPHKSEVYRRILSDDPDIVMPTPSSHLTLSNQEIATLVKWIEDGAEYKPHWSFIPVEKPALPSVAKIEAISNDIDRFVLAKLEAQDLTFSSSASKEKLARRASFDLRGLPPTLDEIETFVKDNSANAYEKLIDRFIESPAYGERMAADWMDVARYTDSDGYLDDKHRDFSPYRDWVIKAFNENQSYKQFVTWQLAGDLLPDKTQESILATAFNRLHKKNSEAGIVFEEFRVEYVADRTNTFGTAFLGLSAECARCHDHKYDPISQKNYFELFAFFNSTDEFGSAVYGPDQTPGPSLLLMDKVSETRLDSLRETIKQLENEKEQILRKTANNSIQFVKNASKEEKVRRSLRKKLLAHYDFEGSTKQSKSKYTVKDVNGRAAPMVFNREPVIKDEGYKGKGYFVSEYNTGSGPEDLGWFDRIDPFSIQFAIFPDTLYEEAHFLWHSEERRLGFKGYNFALDSNRLRFFLSHSWPQNAIDLKSEVKLPAKKWTHITITYDGSSTAKGVKMYLDGREVQTIVDRDHLYKTIAFEPNIHTYGFNNLRIGSRQKEIVLKNSGIDELKVYKGTLTPSEVAVSLDLPLDEETYIPADFAQNNSTYKAYESKLHQAREAENEFMKGIPEIMVMGDLPEPRPTYVLNRGVYSEHGEEVEPSTPEEILAFNGDLPKNRLGLTEWLFDKENPLTARVYVNRIWMMHFGRGIVKTVEDFGNQGSLPSHPDLLDWLAADFMENGWDIKRLHKQIMMSTTYRQTSFISSESLESDPDNVWLARGSKFRLPAEMIRDNALAISGLLEAEIGGEAAYPYQPAGLWGALTTKHWAYRYPHDKDEGIYRRSLYTVWKRQAPHPAMQIFDIANRDVCTVRRKVTNTPLQALTLLNDPQFVEASRKLAERVIGESKDLNQQLQILFQLCTSREATSDELALLNELYENQEAMYSSAKSKAISYLNTGKSPWNIQLDPAQLAAMGIVANSILNTDEAIVRR